VHGAPGRIQFTSILSILLITVGGYFAYALVPVYADNYTLKQDLSGIANQAWRKMGKEELQKQVIEKASAIGSHVEIPRGGLPVTVKGLPVGEDEVVVVCTDQAGDCSGDGEVTVAVNYARIVPLPYLKDRFVTLHFSPSAKETLKPVEW
jgi:hypothetical protein